MPRLVFRYVGNKPFDFSNKKIGFFAQNRPILARNWNFCSYWARPCWLIWFPVGELVGGCGARAVSRKTPILYRLTLTWKKYLTSASSNLDPGQMVLRNPLPPSPRRRPPRQAAESQATRARTRRSSTSRTAGAGLLSSRRKI